MKHKPLRIIKANGRVQRSDTTLNADIASGLVRAMKENGGVFTNENERNRQIPIVLPDGTPYFAPYYTVQEWVRKEIVIPETRQTLRDVLQAARDQYHTSIWKEKRNKALEEAETKLHRAVRIRTKEPVTGMFGVIKHPETGKPLMRENAKLLNTQVNAAKFIVERLAPDVYGKVEKSDNRHLVFSLSDLRKYEENKKKAQQ